MKKGENFKSFLPLLDLYAAVHQLSAWHCSYRWKVLWGTSGQQLFGSEKILKNAAWRLFAPKTGEVLRQFAEDHLLQFLYKEKWIHMVVLTDGIELSCLESPPHCISDAG